MCGTEVDIAVETGGGRDESLFFLLGEFVGGVEIDNQPCAHIGISILQIHRSNNIVWMGDRKSRRSI